MSDARNQKRGGAAAMLALFCVAAGGAGLAFDLTSETARGFWVGAQPGAGAVLGLIAALFVVLCGYLARFLLTRRTRAEQSDV
jgi:hypothetical protein